MMRLFCLVAAMAITATTSRGTLLLDPEKLEMAPSTCYALCDSDNPRYYNNYLYEKKVIFRVLPGFAPVIECLILEAKGMGQMIRLEDPTIINFDSIEAISENLSIDVAEDNILIIDPDYLHLYKKHKSGNQEGCNISPPNHAPDFVATRNMYDALIRARAVAKASGKLIKINLSAINKAKARPEYCISLVAADEDDEVNMSDHRSQAKSGSILANDGAAFLKRAARCRACRPRSAV